MFVFSDIDKRISDIKSDNSPSIGIKLADGAKLPQRGTSESAGYDLYAFIDEDIEIKADTVKAISTGVYLEMKSVPNLFAKIESRSGLSLKNSINVNAGVLDNDYTGEVTVILRNNGKTSYIVKKGDRIAQLIFMYNVTPKFNIKDKLEVTSRGAGGFGSTGK